MDNSLDLFREMEGKPVRAGNESKTRVKKDRGKRDVTRKEFAPRNKQPRASERASEVGQDWYDRGVAHGFTFPYDVNYFALALQKRVEEDPRMQRLLQQGKPDNVQRWLTKMVDNWWRFYADDAITASNAKDYFLGHDWEDLRDWALANLAKDRAMKLGTRVPPPIYPNQQEYQQRLRDQQRKASVDNYLRTLEDAEEIPERAPLDPEARERLRSFGDRRRKRRKP